MLSRVLIFAVILETEGKKLRHYSPRHRQRNWTENRPSLLGKLLVVIGRRLCWEGQEKLGLTKQKKSQNSCTAELTKLLLLIFFVLLEESKFWNLNLCFLLTFRSFTANTLKRHYLFFFGLIQSIFLTTAAKSLNSIQKTLKIFLCWSTPWQLECHWNHKNYIARKFHVYKLTSEHYRGHWTINLKMTI